tara:strand:- start:1814 stop:2386 length:573 start_codon:yes stop_codon:yes gene_type:complete
MKNYLPYLLVVTSTIIFTLFLIDNENKVQKLEQQIQMQNIHHDSLNNCIDSLYHEIDTLLIDLEIWDYNITNNTTHLLSAIIRVESSGNDSAYNASEDAVGCLQIRKCMVDDVNRILRRQKSSIYFTYEDRWCRVKSVEMFDVYCKHYNLNSAEEIARCWNGGPRGINNPATAGYWNKVQNKIEEEYALR